MSLLIRQRAGTQFLETSAGVPWQMRGDSPWELPVKLQDADVASYFANRQAKGFNTGLMELITVQTSWAPSAPANAYGELPFTGTPFQSSLNTAYWNRIRSNLQRAADANFVVQAVPCYIGFEGGDEGWWDQMVAAGASNVQAYAAAVASYIGDFDNIIWVNGGDWYPTSNFNLITAVANGILSVDTRHLITTHWARQSSGTDNGPYSWLTLNSSYPSQATVSSLVLSTFQNNTPLPTYMIEGNYEGSFGGGPTLNAKDVRVESWQACLQGGRSDNYGNHTIWPFLTGWQTAMNSDGAVSLGVMHAFMDTISWWLLMPDASNQMVQAGSRGTIGTAAYVAAARATDNSLGVAVIPPGGSITLNMGVFSAPPTAFFLDPSNGARSTVAGGPFPNSGTKVFTAPGNNASGETDWVLVVQVPNNNPSPAFGFWTQ